MSSGVKEDYNALNFRIFIVTLMSFNCNLCCLAVFSTVSLILCRA